MNRRTKILLIIAAVLAVFVLIFYIPSLFPKPAKEAEPEFSVLSPEEQKQLDEVRKIKNLSFDVGLFQDPILKSLKDIPLPPAPTEPVGRPNPFLPF